MSVARGLRPCGRGKAGARARVPRASPILANTPAPRLAGCSLHAPGSSFPLAGSSLRKMGRHPGRFREHPASGGCVPLAMMEHPAGWSGVPAACGVFPPPRMEHPAPSMDHPGRRREHPGRNGAGEKGPKSAFLPRKRRFEPPNSPRGSFRQGKRRGIEIMAGRFRFRRPSCPTPGNAVSQKGLASSGALPPPPIPRASSRISQQSASAWPTTPRSGTGPVQC